MAPNMHLEPEPWRRKSPVARHAGKRDRLFSRVASPTSEPIFFSGLQFPVGCAREGGRVLLPEVRFYAWVPQQLPEPEPHRSRGTGAAGVRTGVAMVTRERLRWGRAKGGSTCRYSRLGGILTSRPCCGAMVWAGRGLSGLGPIKGRRRRQLGVVLGASVYWGSRG